MFQLLMIEDFKLAENKVRILPGSVSKFKNLRSLDMHSNELEAIPPDLGMCTQLTHVDLSHNHLMGLPAEIGRLDKVKYFDISDNQVELLPDTIGNMTSLTELNLDSNKLIFIPVEIEALETSLTKLHASGNVIRDPPNEIMVQVYAYALFSLDGFEQIEPMRV